MLVKRYVERFMKGNNSYILSKIKTYSFSFYISVHCTHSSSPLRNRKYLFSIIYL